VQDLPRHVLASLAAQEQKRGHDVFRLRNAAQGKRAATREQLLIGDASKARDKLGWSPTVSFAELVAMMVDSDIAAAKAGW